jgi:hypothetical protein
VEVIVPLIMFLAIGIGAVTLAVRSLPEGDREWMRTLLLASLLVRIGAATVFQMFPSLRVFHEDAAGHEYFGMQMASVWRGDAPPFEYDRPNPGFIYLGAALYFVFGRFAVVLPYFNCIMGTLVAFFVYKLAVRFFHPAVGRLSALLVGLMPSMVLWSSVALKDTVVTLALVIALSSCISLKERASARAILGIVVPILAVQSIRFYMVYFMGFAIIVSLVLDRGMSFFTGIYKQIFVVLAVAALFTMAGTADRAESDLRYFNLEYASSYRYGMAITANSGFDADVDVSTPAKAMAYLPIGIAHLLWAPFPWQMVSLRPLLAAPETILWWFMFPATLRGIIFAVRRRFSATSALLIFAITLTCAYSLIHGNVGSAFRQRAQILVFLFIFSAAGIYMKRLRKFGYDPDHVLSAQAPTATATIEPTLKPVETLIRPGQMPRA